MTKNPHFEFPRSWDEARALIEFEPLVPANTVGRKLESFAVFVRDHKLREIARRDRNLEACYDGFSLSQSRRSAGEARRMAQDVGYGRFPRTASVAGHEARLYELGPEPADDDIDPRSPAVVVWADGELFFLIASDTLPAEQLRQIAESMYPAGPNGS